VKVIAQDTLDWAKLGPVVAKFRSLIESEIKADTRKLTSFEAFQRATADDPSAVPASPGRGSRMVLRTFADKRSAYLANYVEPKPSPDGTDSKTEPRKSKESDR
jgi:hypothetical protein